MSRLIQVGVFLALALSIAYADSALGQVAKGQLLVQPMGGIAVPLGDLKQVAKSGSTLGISFDYMIADFVSIGTGIQIASFRTVSYGRSVIYGTETDTSRSRKFLDFSLAMRLYLSRRWLANPFLEAGGSLLCASFKETRPWQLIPSVVERLVVGHHFGGGLETGLSRSSRILVSVDYHSIVNPDRRKYLHYWTMRAGLAIQFRPL